MTRLFITGSFSLAYALATAQHRQGQALARNVHGVSLVRTVLDHLARRV